MDNLLLKKIRNAFQSIILIAAAISCSTEFTSIDQATNEVNKNGFREGRWVDFYDLNKGVITDTSKGYDYFMLTEYSKGRILGEMQLFNSIKVKVQQLLPISSENTLFEKNIDKIPSFQSRTTFDTNGYIVTVEKFNQNLMLEDISENSANNINYNLKNFYTDSSLNKTTFEVKNATDTKDFIILLFSDDLMKTKPLNKDIISSINKSLDDAIKGNIILERIIYTYNNPLHEDSNLDNLYKNYSTVKIPSGIKQLSLSLVIWNSDTINVSKIINDRKKAYADRIRIERQERIDRKPTGFSDPNLREWLRRGETDRLNNQSQDNSNSGGIPKTCNWCNKTFRGNHYSHLGRMADCYSTSSYNTVNKFCSMSCCSDSRRRGGGF